MKRMPSACVLAALALMFVGCTTGSSSMKAGNELYVNGQYVAAKDAFSEAIDAHPQFAEPWNNRAAARLRLGDVNGAIADYNHAADLAPKDPEIYYNRANALVAAGLYQEAIGDYTRALELNPYFARAIFNRGTVYALLGQRDVAQTDWSRAIGLEGDPWAQSAMRRIAGLETPQIVAAVGPANVPQPAVGPAPVPGTRVASVPVPDRTSPVRGTPPVPPAASPVLTSTPPTSSPQPAASVQAVDARALASRAVARELDGDHVGAIQDLRTALTLEPDPARRAKLARLIQLLDTPR